MQYLNQNQFKQGNWFESEIGMPVMYQYKRGGGGRLGGKYLVLHMYVYEHNMMLESSAKIGNLQCSDQLE